MKESEVFFFLTALIFIAFWLVSLTGAVDSPSTWTASDMRGEVQKRLERLEERAEDARFEWELKRIEAERAELLAIVEAY